MDFLCCLCGARRCPCRPNPPGAGCRDTDGQALHARRTPLPPAVLPSTGLPIRRSDRASRPVSRTTMLELIRYAEFCTGVGGFQTQKKSTVILSKLWWSMRDLNPRPPQCECGALSAELIPHHMIISYFRFRVQEI